MNVGDTPAIDVLREELEGIKKTLFQKCQSALETAIGDFIDWRGEGQAALLYNYLNECDSDESSIMELYVTSVLGELVHQEDKPCKPC